METVHTQVQLIKRGVERLIGEIELASKIERSTKSGKPLIIKLGVDPTAPDIHLGHTVPLRKLKHFQDLGHEVVFLIGDFTGRIGDPSGRDKTRPPLTEQEILQNARTYIEQVSKILDPGRLRVEYNSTWLNNLTFGELIRMAANTTMSKMLEHNTFRQRLESSDSIRMHEMLYPFMQGFDSVALKADVELGGSDQTFNLTFGRDLQRIYAQEPQVCITMPILTGTDGAQKMSKSLGNYIGINEPPAIMFNKVMQMNDSNIVNYMTLLTDIPEGEVNLVATQLAAQPKTAYIIEQKKRLALEIITGFHSPEEAQSQIDAYGRLDRDGIPELVLIREQIHEEMEVAFILTDKLGVKSLSEARRLITQGAVHVNGTKINDGWAKVTFQDGDILKYGKTNIVRIKHTR